MFDLSKATIIKRQDPELDQAFENKEKNIKSNTVNKFRVGDIVELINHISDGYKEGGDYNVIFPPPTIVKIIKVKRKESWLKYGVKVIKENDLPVDLQGKQFRSVMDSTFKKGMIGIIGDKPSFFDGDEGIEQKHWDKIYWQPESYLRELT